MVSLFNLVQIVLIDLSLAGDNAMVVGTAVSSLPLQQQRRAMTIGIAAATVLRIVMAFFAVQLLNVTGLMAAGGLLLLWVGWKMAHELRHQQHVPTQGSKAKKSSDAILQIIVADMSMSLDNVLGVAGVARDHMPELILGLALSVALMGLASSQIARLTVRYPKFGYVGVAIVLYTALHMIYEGAASVKPAIHAFV